MSPQLYNVISLRRFGLQSYFSFSSTLSLSSFIFSCSQQGWVQCWVVVNNAYPEELISNTIDRDEIKFFVASDAKIRTYVSYRHISLYIYLFIYLSQAICRSISIYLSHHHITLPAGIFLTLSRHLSITSIGPGRSSGLYPVSAPCCCI